jgi:Fur family peroxide stress response transcriptional regulator
MHYRQSKQREKILQLIQETDVHPTADWVYRKLKPRIPGLSLGTVYRNLSVLEEQGLIRKMALGGTDRFEGNIIPHYHLVCDRCGVVTDIEMPIYAEINKRACKMSSFKIDRHRIDFFGICKKCQTQTSTTNKRKGR